MNAMYTIVTTCPECKASQLADGRLVGKKVKCAKCEQEFKCSKALGPVLWVREFKEGESEVSFRKVATKVLFTYGIAVPVSHQGLFMEHLGDEMAIGSRRKVTLVLDGVRFQVNVSYFKNRRNEPSLHFLWKSEDAIAMKLRQVLSRAYRHFVVEGNTDYIEGESVVMKPGSKDCCFELTVYSAGADTPVQGNLFAAPKRKPSLKSALKGAGMEDLLSELSL